MATRGVKPKPAHLRLVDGTRNATRHGSEADLREKVDSAKVSFGKLVKPKSLKGEGASAWKRYIEPSFWLDVSKEAAAIAFCELWQEFRFAPTSFPASKHGQMRAYMSELGLTDERNRLGSYDEQPSDEFFDE
jgi:hypothetical protein